MHKILPAIAFCLALPTAAFADNVAAAPKPAQPPLAREGLMHATLVVPAPGAVGPRAPEPGVRKAALDDGAQRAPAGDGGEQSPGRGMLLAALVLMAGIVLRRWGGKRP